MKLISIPGQGEGTGEGEEEDLAELTDEQIQDTRDTREHNKKCASYG